MNRVFGKYVGNKDFYKMVLTVVIPIIVQNGITNFVALLDNVMVGRVGTEQMSGVAIVNQLIFVYNLGIFGGLSGAGIFTAQFFGCKKQDGIIHTFRFKILTGAIFTMLAILLFCFGGRQLIALYLHGSENQEALEKALYYGHKYLMIILVGLPAFAFSQCYTSTMRECGETVLPMKAGIVAVFVNLALNSLLIFGLLGFPALGVAGAAIATVISRYVEMLIVVVWMHKNKEQYPFMESLYQSIYVPANLIRKIITKGFPLLYNELFWAAGVAIMMQCYSVRGLEAVAGLNITSTISNLFNVVMISMGNAVAIIIGQLLGAGNMKEAKQTDTRMIAFSVFCSFVLALILILMAPLFPMLYNTTDQVKKLATGMLCISAAFMPFHAFLNASYFTLRAGGKTIVTFLFDSAYMWAVSIPCAFLLSRFTQLPIIPLYLLCQTPDLIKCVVGYVLVKKDLWLTNIVEE